MALWAMWVRTSAEYIVIDLYHWVTYIPSLGGARLRVFKTKEFKRFARKESISNDDLCTAIERATRGIVDASLGHGLIKQRIPRKGQGRSGGFRTIIAYQHGNRSFFVYGFAKNEMDNIAGDDLKDVASYAAALLALTDKLLTAALKARKIEEVMCDA